MSYRLMPLALFALLSSCGAPQTPAIPPVPSPSAAKPAPPPIGPLKDVVFDVPKLKDVAIDGKKDDWKDGGLAVDVLASLPSESRDPDTFDARARLGWDERGLLIACDV